MEKSTVLLLSKLHKVSGNFCTATRIKSHIEKAGYQCILREAKSIENLEMFLQEKSVSVVFAIHAYLSGQILTDIPPNIPYVIILGGTDVNEYSHDKHKMEIMTPVIQNARYVVGFSQEMVNKASSLWENVDTRSFLSIPQAVVTFPSNYSLLDYLETSGQVPIGVSTNALDIFLLVGGIRPVKDPLYLTEVFSDWHYKHETSLLVIIGPKIDENYQQQFLDRIRDLPGIVYISGLSQADTHACIQQSCALVNSSISEGMSAAVLEAMQLGTPVIARNIPGNSSILQDGISGLLYDTPKDFLDKVHLLLTDSALCEQIRMEAKAIITKWHCIKKEKQAYTSLLESLQSDNKRRPDPIDRQLSSMRSC